MAKQPVQFPFNGGPQQGGVSTLPFKLFFATLPLSTTKAQVHNCHFPICGSRFLLSIIRFDRACTLSLSLSVVFNAFPYAPILSSFANAAGIKLFDRFGSESCFIVVARATGIARLSKDPTVPNQYRCNSIFFHSFSSLSLFSFCFLFVE